MLRPEPLGTPVRNRLSGEDAPIWLTAGFAAIGTLVAGAAAWLALTAQPAPPQQARADVPEEQSAMPRTLPATDTATGLPSARESRAAAELRGAGGAPSTAAPSAAAPADARAAVSPDDTSRTALPATLPLGRAEDCPPAVDIPFMLGSARPITKDVQMALDELQAFLKGHSEAKLSIEGHADSMGEEDYNLLLSYRRAKAVVALLRGNGLPERRMLVRAAGTNAPIEGLPGDSGKNRRVVLQVTGIESCREAPGASLQP